MNLATLPQSMISIPQFIRAITPHFNENAFLYFPLIFVPLTWPKRVRSTCYYAKFLLFWSVKIYSRICHFLNSPKFLAIFFHCKLFATLSVHFYYSPFYLFLGMGKGRSMQECFPQRSRVLLEQSGLKVYLSQTKEGQNVQRCLTEKGYQEKMRKLKNNYRRKNWKTEKKKSK